MNTIPNDRPPTKPLTPEHAKGARLLIGWVPEDFACAALAGPAAMPPYSAEIRERIHRAQQVVRERPAIDRTQPVISEAPAALAPYVAELTVKPFFQSFRAEGWRVCMADLRHVQVIQWKIQTAHAAERAETAADDDVSSLAKITLPLSRAKELTGNGWSLDGRMFMVTCRNPMLRVVPLQLPGFANPVFVTLEDVVEQTTGLELKRVSFHLLIDNSQVQVVRWRGAYFLRDGNHRAFGLFTRGITDIPVLYREYTDNEDPGLPKAEIFDPAVYLGERPPMLADFLDETVAAPVDVRSTQKTFLFQVIENDVPLL
jgi:hypothetical protein